MYELETLTIDQKSKYNVSICNDHIPKSEVNK